VILHCCLGIVNTPPSIYHLSEQRWLCGG